MRISKQSWLLLVAVLLTGTISAKKGDKVKGYIINSDDDRIEGTITIGSITDNEVKVEFLSSRGGKKTVYKPKDLLAYGYELEEIDEIGKKTKRWVHYERQKVDFPPKPFGSTTVFMEKEESGEMTLYCYYIEVRNNPKKPYKYEYYIKVGEDDIKKVTRDDFRKDTKSAFGEYTALSNRIGTQQFQYRNLDRMVRDYNYWTVNKHDSKEYRVAMKN